MKATLKVILLFFVFSILFILPAVLLPLQVKMGSQSENNGLMLILFLLTELFIVLYLIKRLNLWGIKLFLAVVVIFWGLQTFMTQIETWYFRAAMPAITNGELMNLFLRPLITSVTFVPIAMWVLGKWRQDANTSEFHSPGKLHWKELLGLSAAYVAIYFIFGYYVAWQFEAVRIFYSGSAEDVGFLAQMQSNFQTQGSIFGFQLFRGFLWILFGLPAVLYLKGGKTEKMVACAILYSVTAIQLIVDNPFMPQEVRIAHLLEVASSNGLFGLLIGYAATREAVLVVSPTMNA